MYQRVALIALLYPQHTVGACGPEEFVLWVDFR
jgi:hypothetical protein